MTDALSNVYINWKDTDACLSFTCECGAKYHIDAYFVYNIQCANCKNIYEMPTSFFLNKIENPTTPVCVCFEED